MTDLLEAAKALLGRIDEMTTEEFSRGGERVEREALRLAIAQAEWPRGTRVRMPDRDQIYEVDRAYLRDADVYVLASYQHAPQQRIGLDQPVANVVRVA